MTKAVGRTLGIGLLACVTSATLANAQAALYPVIVDKVANGTVKVEPPLPPTGNTRRGPW